MSAATRWEKASLPANSKVQGFHELEAQKGRLAMESVAKRRRRWWDSTSATASAASARSTRRRNGDCRRRGSSNPVGRHGGRLDWQWPSHGRGVRGRQPRALVGQSDNVLAKSAAVGLPCGSSSRHPTMRSMSELLRPSSCLSLGSKRRRGGKEPVKAWYHSTPRE